MRKVLMAVGAASFLVLGLKTVALVEAAPGDVWRLRLTFVTDVGGVGNFLRPGCDGAIEPWHLGGPPKAARVQVMPPGKPDQVHLDRFMAGDSVYLMLTSPPPYEVRLLGFSENERDTTSYWLCPWERGVVILTQRDFDRKTGARAGEGRYFSHTWRLWWKWPLRR